jgi:guanylate kinase
MNKPLYLFVGKSASGKTTIAEILESEYRLNTLQSYTTRPKRYADETGHTFITKEEFNNLTDIIAYTKYNGHHYCCTQQQVDKADIYVIDVPGVKTLLEKYQTDRQIVILYFDTTVPTRIDRMIDRGSSDTEIVSRLYNDEQSDWSIELLKIARQYKTNQLQNVEAYIIDANQNIEDVVFNIKFYIQCTNKE